MTETTARDDLEVRLIRDAGLSPHWAKRQVDAFAHELAEQQRALLRSKGTVWTGSIGQVINHIDPGEQPAVDAVDAAMPSAPADRAAILAEAIARVEDPKERLGLGWESARDVLRRMADEAQQTAVRPSCPDPIECGHEAALGQAQQEIRRLGLMVDEYGVGASALGDKLRRVRDLHRETCILVRGEVKPTAFKCGMCEVLDAPADAVLPEPADRTAELSPAERTMLTYALNQAQLRMWATGKFTDEEQAAVVSLRRMADEAQQTAPWLSDSARIGRTLIWTWADIGKGVYGQGYRAAQAEARALLTGQRDSDEAQQPETQAPVCMCGHPMHQHHEDVCLTECGCNDGQQLDDATDLPGRLAAALTARFTELGNPFAAMRYHEQGPDGWPASHSVGPNKVADVLRELLAHDEPAAVSQPGKEA